MSFIYNLGAANLGSSMLFTWLNAGDYAGSTAQLPRRNKAGGQVLAVLAARRRARQICPAKSRVVSGR
ncbi:glycoside hydrolase family protein [Pseudomonas gingeri]|uniref:glycoside hydrolase family protein n=1 Tax=Pseudomonas gingeri TaxID=117681 RepID=UPI002737D5F8|nr:hypothetical protein [Pseudomonas gingeri]